MPSFRPVLKIVKDLFAEFSANKVPKLAAALAYYTIFALPSLLLIVMRLSDVFYGQDAIEGRLYKQLVDLVGREGAGQIQEVIRNTTLSADGYFAAIAGIFTLLLGATGVFVEIQDSINQVWHLKARPRKGKGIIKMLINRLLSFSMIAVLAFLLLVSLIANSLMDVLIQKLFGLFPNVQVYVIYIVNAIFSFLVISVLLAVIFKVLPDARVRWKDVWPGVIVTALLFMAGRFGISYYLGTNKVTTSYGAAGSVLILLIWVYFSAIILYIGAVFTRVYAIHKGSRIYPNSYAVWVEKQEVEAKGRLPSKSPESGG